MAGENISYNLRPNKHIERRLFVDLLSLLCDKPRDNYAYISMGGPQLVDHKLMHYELGFKKLYSIESDPNVFDRQIFNLRPGCIHCELQSVNEMISNFADIDERYPEEDYIIWLDYAAANERYEQLSEFQSLVSTLNSGDLVKITINVNPTSLGQRQSNEESGEELQERRFKRIRSQISEYFDDEKFDKNDITNKKFVNVIRRGVELSLISGLREDLYALNVLSFAYSDGTHKMLNVAYKLYGSETEIERTRVSLNSDWEFMPDNSEDVKKINIPSLSLKERLLIDSKLYCKSIDEIHDEILPFQLDNDPEISKRILNQYFKHYRRYPNYFDINI
ncbi:O-methyltransferase [Lewinella cohaerens]|uniref:O-methyltransferase n=1 Tax=Lewinella cohaerens TaxID=70995 RepID=UPI0003772749|nr:O-methyltransferase [Lewinella cohaerens]